MNIYDFLGFFLEIKKFIRIVNKFMKILSL